MQPVVLDTIYVPVLRETESVPAFDAESPVNITNRSTDSFASYREEGNNPVF